MIVKPEEVGLSGERLARIEQHLNRRYIEPKKIAGTLTLVARHGQVAYLSPLGLMDIERTKAYDRRHHLPHLLHDQTDHLSGLDDAL